MQKITYIHFSTIADFMISITIQQSIGFVPLLPSILPITGNLHLFSKKISYLLKINTSRCPGLNLRFRAHRFFHEWNIGWAAHSVHHSSEDYNFSTAFRQSVLQLQYNEILMVPCACLGIHWSMFYAHYGLRKIFKKP